MIAGLVAIFDGSATETILVRVVLLRYAIVLASSGHTWGVGRAVCRVRWEKLRIRAKVPANLIGQEALTEQDARHAA